MFRILAVFLLVCNLFAVQKVTVLAPRSDSTLVSEVTSELTTENVEKYQFSIVFKDVEKSGVFITVEGTSYSVDNFSTSSVDSLLSTIDIDGETGSGGNTALFILLAFMIFLPYLVFKFRKSTQKLLSDK